MNCQKETLSSLSCIGTKSVKVIANLSWASILWEHGLKQVRMTGISLKRQTKFRTALGGKAEFEFCLEPYLKGSNKLE